jgi:hypothetical protein
MSLTNFSYYSNNISLEAKIDNLNDSINNSRIASLVDLVDTITVLDSGDSFPLFNGNFVDISNNDNLTCKWNKYTHFWDYEIYVDKEFIGTISIPEGYNGYCPRLLAKALNLL